MIREDGDSRVKHAMGSEQYGSDTGTIWVRFLASHSMGFKHPKNGRVHPVHHHKSGLTIENCTLLGCTMCVEMNHQPKFGMCHWCIMHFYRKSTETYNNLHRILIGFKQQYHYDTVSGIILRQSTRQHGFNVGPPRSFFSLNKKATLQAIPYHIHYQIGSLSQLLGEKMKFQRTNQIMNPSCFLFHTISIVSLLCIQQYLTSFHGFIHQRQSLDRQLPNRTST